MKRFLLFQGEHYYAEGGWDDFEASFKTLEEAQAFKVLYPSNRHQWWHVVDVTKGVVYRQDID